MRSWLVRGLVMAVLHAAVLTALAVLRAHDPTSLGVLRPAGVGLLVALAAAWGAVDALRAPECGMTWFKAGLLAGPVAGLLGVIAQGAFVDATGIEALGVALTGGAAFTALLVAGPAVLAATVIGRFKRAERTSAE